tara:strand:- start:874 stop:1041 length:168 start_codon:yes stop_codon:yes gene_type:complete
MNILRFHPAITVRAKWVRIPPITERKDVLPTRAQKPTVVIVIVNRPRRMLKVARK